MSHADPNSLRVMAPIDKLHAGFRALVHEYGAVIVLQMMAQGYSDPDELRPVLETWRERRQAECATPEYARNSRASRAQCNSPE